MTDQNFLQKGKNLGTHYLAGSIEERETLVNVSEFDNLTVAVDGASVDVFPVFDGKPFVAPLPDERREKDGSVTLQIQLCGVEHVQIRIEGDFERARFFVGMTGVTF